MTAEKIQPHTPTTDGCARGPCRLGGFTLVEVMVGIALMVVGLGGIVGLLIVNERSLALANDAAMATNEFRGLAERIRSTPFDGIVTAYTGFTFTVPALMDSAGTVTIYTDETMSSGDGWQLGLPRDLDGDGAATNTNVAGNAALLPIKLELAWTLQGHTEMRSLYLLLSLEE